MGVILSKYLNYYVRFMDKITGVRLVMILITGNMLDGALSRKSLSKIRL